MLRGILAVGRKLLTFLWSALGAGVTLSVKLTHSGSRRSVPLKVKEWESVSGPLPG